MSRVPANARDHATPIDCRLIIDAPLAGPWNMAVDEALLESASRDTQFTLRFYRWSEPTLSLGYFQNYRERERHRASLDCAIVRRMTGGGAILHDQEITYSLAAPVDRGLTHDSTWLYAMVHEALIETFYEYSLEARRLTKDERSTDAEQPFLCFERRATGDVVFGQAKICGSAQRRRGGAIVQHGSLILARSKHAPELPGMAELAGFSVKIDELVTTWAGHIARRANLRLTMAPLPPEILDRVRLLTIEKYTTNAWTQKR
jgi:lipoyl(octanoyl) transferase